MDVSTVNDALRGATVLLRLAFEAREHASTYRLRLELAESEAEGASAISVSFEGVSNLCVSELGGGLTQILGLRVVDVRDRQWESVNFEVSDQERPSISFLCKSIGEVHRYCVGDDGPFGEPPR